MNVCIKWKPLQQLHVMFPTKFHKHTHTFINVTEDNLKNWSLYRDIQYEKSEKKNKVWVY